jgi:UTP15 C terminal
MWRPLCSRSWLCAGAGGVKLPKAQRRFAPRLTAASSKYFTRGMASKPATTDVVVRARKRLRLKPYDKMLKAFRCTPLLHQTGVSNHSCIPDSCGCAPVACSALSYTLLLTEGIQPSSHHHTPHGHKRLTRRAPRRYGDALDAALEHGQVAIVLALLEELAARGGLAAAVRSRGEAPLVKLLAMLNKYVAHPAHAATVLQALNCVLDTRRALVLDSMALVKLLEDLQGRIGAEVKVEEELVALAGPIEMLLR